MAESFLSADEQGLPVARALSNQPVAEEELARLFQPRLLALFLCRTRDREAARDLTAEALIEVIRALRTGTAGDADQLAAFTQATARSLANQYLRSLATLRKRENILSPAAMDRMSEITSPLDAVAENRQRLVSQTIETIEAADRTILTMALVEGRRPADIAERLRLSPDLVRQRKSQAVMKTRIASK
jgi:RNA polymerase sigma factor (sigma-70 family)